MLDIHHSSFIIYLSSFTCIQGLHLLSQAGSSGEQAEPLPWSARMARLLLDAAGTPQSEAAAAGPADTGGREQHSRQEEAWRHWAAALPRSVPLAFAHASGAELRGVGDEGLADEALAVRQLMLDSYAVSFHGPYLRFFRCNRAPRPWSCSWAPLIAAA